MDIGNRLKQLRQNAKLSGKALAKKASIAQSTVSEIESGKLVPGIRIIEKVCQALGITLADFFAPSGVGYETLPDDLAQILERARQLTPEQRTTVYLLINAFLKQSGSRKQNNVAEDSSSYD
ncbi:MAG: helix-turn-helix transcriptional regulator [Bacillota bacterium]|nr:helix-turn-helix transcriptional regulator [Bacillota bacterium]